MPYTYTLAWQAHAQRPAAHAAAGPELSRRPAALDRASEYLWGDDLLVAPVTREGATALAGLSAGRALVRLLDRRGLHEGPRGVTVEAPLDRLPLFVRAGAIMPMGPVVQHLTGEPPDEITLLIYPEGASSFTLYEDDGETNAIARATMR